MGRGKRKHGDADADATSINTEADHCAKGKGSTRHPQVKLEKVQTVLPYTCIKARMEQVKNNSVPAPAPAAPCPSPSSGGTHKAPHSAPVAYTAPEPSPFAIPKPTPSKRAPSAGSDYRDALVPHVESDTGDDRV